ncbi:MAG: M14 family metallopeptidase [Gammaproteobacteria bacterium]|nr:M14 family metallopeptidase [Gammaproteobacteria bacterium]
MTRYEDTITFPEMSLGTRRELKVRRYGQRGARPKAYLQTGLHADEIPGMLVLHHLIGLLNDADDAGLIHGEIVLVPVANPIGLSQHIYGTLLGRFEVGSGNNFNRNYADLSDVVAERVADKLGDDADANTAAIRAELTRAANALKFTNDIEFLRISLLQLAIDTDLCLDLHCDWEAVLHVYLGTPCWPDGADLSAQLGSRATLLATKSGGHPFDEAIAGPWWALAERFPDRPISPACLAATVELRGSTDVGDEMAAADADNLYRMLVRRGYIDGDPGPLPAPLCDATPLTGVETIKADRAGVVAYCRHPGDVVQAGDTVAIVVDPLESDAARARHDVISQVSGILYARRGDRMARPGQTLCRVAGATPLADRMGRNLLSD